MAQVSSIGRQIAPGVYEDANKDALSKYRAVSTGKKVAPQTGNFISDEQAMYGGGMPSPTVATVENPVVKMERGKETPTFDQYDTSVVSTLDKAGLQDFIDQTYINVRRGADLTPEKEAELYKAQRRLQELSMPTEAPNPYEEQIKVQQQMRETRAGELEKTTQQLIDKRRQELEAQYTKRSGELERQGEKVMSAAQRGLSFSGFGRSTYAAEKQAEIQESVNQSKEILQAERDAAMQRYQAELAGADAETLAGYDANIMQLQQQNAQYQIQLANSMNEYNMQTSAMYSEKLDNILQLAQQNVTEDLTEEDQAQASAYATLLIDSKGDINTKLLESMPPRLASLALAQAAANKQALMNQPDAIQYQDWKYNKETGNYERTNQETGELEILGGGVQGSMPTTSNGLPINDAIAIALEKCKDGAQCGKFVNDILETVGIGRLVGNSYDSKVKAIQTVGEAVTQEDIGAGSIFAYPVGGSQYGHIGIITSVNTDGTVNIMDYNYNNDEKQRERNNVNVGEILGKNGLISKPIITQETVQPTGSEEKQTYLEMIRRGQITKSDLQEVAQIAIEGGWGGEFREAMKQGVVVDLTETQQKQYNKEYDRFLGNAVVKGFEEGLTQFQGLGYALGTDSGPGDMAGVFTFMKTLDPTSVVREAEFESAANSAGVVERWKNIYNKVSRGKILTDSQAEDFKKIAKVFIEQKAQSYDRLYSDMLNSYDKFGIPRDMAPLSATEQLKQYLSDTGGDVAEYNPESTYNVGDRIKQGGVVYVIGEDGNAYEE